MPAPADVVLENKLYYQNFGLELDGRAAPDHLLTCSRNWNSSPGWITVKLPATRTWHP